MLTEPDERFELQVRAIFEAPTIAQLTGDLKVAIPLLGKKMEQSAAPAILAGFRTQQKVGDAWLAKS